MTDQKELHYLAGLSATIDHWSRKLSRTDYWIDDHYWHVRGRTIMSDCRKTTALKHELLVYRYNKIARSIIRKHVQPHLCNDVSGIVLDYFGGAKLPRAPQNRQEI